jgi:hypothetical protein
MPTRETCMAETSDGGAAWCGNTLDCRCFLEPGEARFLCSKTSRTYCVSCGQRLRFHRKRALEREDSMPLTFEDVARYFIQQGISS